MIYLDSWDDQYNINVNFRIIWMAGCLAAMSSVTYPAISAFASEHAAPDQQGENY